MAKFHLSNRAVDDLSEIWLYTFYEWSEMQADKYYDLLLNSCQEIANNPALGKRYSEIGNTLLGFKSGEHIILYTEIDFGEIDIVRILHGRMDLKRKFY
jgi:toxin ParE1/3/4